jgi:hypothetical protein
MTSSYWLYDKVLSRDWAGVIYLIKTECKTGGVPLVGVIGLFLFGESYFSFLLINFVSFIFMQIVGIKCIYKITERYIYVLLWIGFTLMLQTPFYWAGDLLDFRQDFIAFCLFTSWMATYLTYLYCGDKKYLIASALIGGTLLFCRMLAALYLGIILIITSILNVFIFNINGVLDEIRNQMKYAIGLIIGGGCFILFRIKSVVSYYVSLHVLGDEPEIRAAEQGVYNRIDNLLFYPKSLVNEHLGVILTLILIAILIIAFWFRPKGVHFSSLSNIRTISFGIISLLVPMVVLTFDESKSSVVISVIAGSCIFVVIVLIYILNLDEKIINKCMPVIVIIGILSYMLNCCQKQIGYSYDEQSSLIAVNETISEYIISENISSPAILVDHLFDAIKNTSVSYWLACNYHRYVYIENAIESMNPSSDGIVKYSEVAHYFEKDEIINALECADIIVVSKDGYGESLYITDQQLDLYRDIMWEYADENLNQVLNVDYQGDEIYVFVR